MRELNKYTMIGLLIGVQGILMAYIIYCFSNPHVNGMLFGTVMGTIAAMTAGVLGFHIGWLRPPPQIPEPEEGYPPNLK